MGQEIIQVDAFTDKPFAGNPAGVCIMPAPRDAAWMQNIAREMNVAETAFVVPRNDEAFDLRWFTPLVEVDLCGHATLASAHVLWQSKRLRENAAAKFHTKSGLLTCTKRDAWIEMDFPSTPPSQSAPPEGLFQSLVLRAQPKYIGRTRFDYLVELSDEAQLRALQPDFGKLRQMEARGVIVTARASTPGFDFVSRFFAPRAGVDEDPATGSSHCALAPYWRERLGKDSMIGFQASPRTGIIRVTVREDRVILAGQAVTTLRGELVV